MSIRMSSSAPAPASASAAVPAVKKTIIGIDASRANARQRTGTEWYAFHLIQELKAIIPDTVQVVLYSKDELRDGLGRLPPNWESRVLRWRPGRFWTQLRLSWEMFRRPPDLLFVPAHALPFVLPERCATTIHDVAFMARPKAYGFFERLYHRLTASLAVDRADLLLTVSEFSRAETVKYFGADPAKVAVTPLGFDTASYRPVTNQGTLDKVLSRYKISRPYFLFVGRLESKKNLAGLLHAYRIFRDKFDMARGHKLVLVGKEGIGYKAAWRGGIISPALRRDVIETGYVCSEDSKYLYAGATALVFPSWYEGFGLPLLEAWACRTPVIASRLASIPEVGGDAVLYVDPSEPEEIAHAMDSVSRDQDLRKDLIDKGQKRVGGHSWRKTAESTWMRLEHLVATRFI
jgi:glycosyltransferase involved in cell wall biosynthesis